MEKILIWAVIGLLFFISGSKCEMFNLTEKNFDTEVSKMNTKWFVVFYVDTCNYCKQTLKTITNDVLPDYEDSKVYKFGKVDCNKEVWLALRFNITQIPYIVLIEDGKMFEFKEFATKEAVETFIEEEKTIEDIIPMPKPMGFVVIMMKMLTESYYLMKETIQKFLDSKGINIKINDYMMIALGILFFMSVLFIENEIINMCCMKKKKKGVQKEGEKGKEGEKKEEKKEEEKKENEKSNTSKDGKKVKKE